VTRPVGFRLNGRAVTAEVADDELLCDCLRERLGQVGTRVGCREGICHTCIGRLCSGRVRDLRNGQLYGTEGEMVRTCINAPEGAVEIDL